MSEPQVLRGRVVTESEVIADGAIVFDEVILKCGAASKVLCEGEAARAERIDGYIPVSYTHLTLPTKPYGCRSRWSPYH